MYPEKSAFKIWGIEPGVVGLLVMQPGGFWCGYARFFEPTGLREPEYGGIVTYVPVHGGVTYAKRDERGMVYGFDCNHVWDERRPETWDQKWLVAEVERMVLGIRMAVHFESVYLAAGSNRARARVIDQYHQGLRLHGVDFRLEDNFGAMIKVMFGGL